MVDGGGGFVSIGTGFGAGVDSVTIRRFLGVAGPWANPTATVVATKAATAMRRRGVLFGVVVS
jgi:hypothetical protein